MILNQNNNLFINNLLFYLSISSIFFITNNFISYKILFGFQTIVFFYLVYSADALYFNKKLLFFNFLIIFLFFFNFTRESIYLLLICFCNVFVDYKKLKNINLKYNNFFLIIFLILFIALLRKFPEHISIYEYFTMFSDPDHPYKSIFNKIDLQASVQHDQMRGLQYYAGLSLSMTIGKANQELIYSNLESKMTSFVRRDLDIVAQEHENREQMYTYKNSDNSYQVGKIVATKSELDSATASNNDIDIVSVAGVITADSDALGQSEKPMVALQDNQTIMGYPAKPLKEFLKNNKK